MSKVRRYKDSDVLTVETEAAGLYAVAKHRTAECGCPFYVTDSLADLNWKPRFHDATRHSITKGIDIVLTAAELLLGSK